MNRRAFRRLFSRSFRTGMLDSRETRPAPRVSDRSTLQGLSKQPPNTNRDGRSNATLEIAVLRRRLIRAQVDTVMALVAAVEAKDPYTEQHSVNVPLYAEAIARAMRLSARETEVIKIAALLHDCGKIGVQDSILTKPGPLTTEEFALVKQHPEIGAAILRSATYLRRELPLVLYHHERYDGTGYPAGLKGNAIPLGARILNVADSLDAMMYPRSYKRALDPDEAASELVNCSGRQFDPEVAEVALRWMKNHPEELITDSMRAPLCGIL